MLVMVLPLLKEEVKMKLLVSLNRKEVDDYLDYTNSFIIGLKDYSINYLNYILAVVITCVFSMVTSYLCRRHIRDINMIESLKQVE